MFNVSKKTLSVVLCLALLLSVVAVCFMTPATAKTVTSTQDFTVYKDSLAKDFVPDVNLTFEGDAPYGIPYGCYSNGYFNGYKNGAVEIKSGGHWVFIGKDGTVGKNFLSFQGSTNDNHKTAVANLYTFEVGKTYMVSFDVKSLKGSTVKANDQANIRYGMAADPSAGAAKQHSETGTLMSDYKSNGFALEYKVNGVAQEVGTVLEVDSDWQTATAVFKVKTAGKFGIHVNIGDTVQIDNVKIYNLNNIWSSGENFQNKITFDLGGWGNDRDSSLQAGYATEENGNKYGTIGKSEGGALFPSSGEYGSFISVLYNKHTSEQGLADIASMQSRLFKFEPGKSYEVTFKYRYPTTGHQSGCEPVIGTTNIGVRLMADPGGAAHAADDILKSSNSWVKNLKTDGLALKVDPASGLWQECKVSFTVKTQDEVADYAKVRAGTATEFDFNGGYFCIRSDYRAIHIDDYEVKEFDAEKSSSVSITTDYVYHDMENDTVSTSTGATANGTIVANNNSGASIVDSGDDKHGKVLNLDANGSRFTIANEPLIQIGKKYYISFDAKATDTTKAFGWMGLCFKINGTEIHKGSQSGTRVVISSNDHATGRNAFKYYVNGAETNFSTFNSLTTEWKHYGLVLDLTNEANVNYLKQVCPTIFNNTQLLFYVGVKNSQYDNFSIVSSVDVAGAVPESTGDELNYLSKSYKNNMDATTIANNKITNYDGTTTSVVAVEGRGNVIKVDSGMRFCVNDTNFISVGHKYTISFDARLDVEDSTTKGIYMILHTDVNSGAPKRYFIHNAGNNKNDGLNAAFKFYEQDLATGNITEIKEAKNLTLTKTWKKYIIEFDYTESGAFATGVNAAVGNTQLYGLTNKNSYLSIGNVDGLFDNLEIVEYTQGDPDVEVSIRKPSGKGENYLSAGLRFKTAVDNNVVKNAAEIGFVVAPSTNAARTDGWWELKNGLNPIARKGVVKVGVNQDGWYYAKDTSHTYYQMVITGLSQEGGLTAYNRRFSAVLYVKNTDGSYDYYALGEASYYQVFGITETLKAPKIKEAE